jgi:hypothetical protein
MKNRWQAISVVTIAGLLFIVSDAPSDAARRVTKGSSYDGTWSVAIYTLRGDCGSLRAALRIVGGRVYSGDGSYQAYGSVGAGGAIRVTGVLLGENVSARGQRHGMRPTKPIAAEAEGSREPIILVQHGSSVLRSG